MLKFPRLSLLAAVSLFHSIHGGPNYFRSDLGVPRTSATFPSDLASPQNLVWRAELDSGHSTPAIDRNKIFLTTSRIQNNELATVCLEGATGKILWRQVLPIPKVEEFHPQEGNGAMATPALDGERVFVFFGSYGLICYDYAGKQLWEQKLGPFRDEYGAASSPIIIDDKVILNEDHDIDSFLVAFDRATGRQLWKTSRPGAVRSYSTPAIRETNGSRQLVVAGALELAGYDPSNGEKLWWVNGLARIAIPAPLPVGDVIYMATWSPGGDPGQRVSLAKWPDALARWDKNKDGKLARNEIDDGEVLSRFFRMDLNQDQQLNQPEWEKHAQVFQLAQNATLAIQPRGRGDLTEQAILWKYQRGAPYVASPMEHEGILWTVKDGGLVTKLDAKTGDLLQQERLGATGNYYASPVTAGGKVYFASEAGVVTIVADQKEWKILNSHKFSEKIFATPVVSDDHLYIRTEKALYKYRQARPLQ